MLLTVTHTTRYSFAETVTHGLQRLRLRPKSTGGQEVLDWTMTLTGAKAEASYEDHNNNRCDLVSIEPGASEIVITCEGTVSTQDTNGVLGHHSGHVPLWCFLRQTPLTGAGNKVRQLVASVDVDPSDTLPFLHALSRAVGEQVRYEPGSSDVDTTAEQALANGSGVCQDHAHVFIAAGRHVDIPMRYVSGYLLMDDKVEQEASHGWAEAHVEGLGWVGFDISNEVCPDERYIRVATGCDYREAAPVTGIVAGAGDSGLEVHLSVDRKLVGAQQQQSSGDGGQNQSQGG